MRVVGLDGEEYEWKYHLYQQERENASKPHRRARELLHSLYPFAKFSEEVPLIGTLKERLIIDIYIHTQRLAIEVQGSQHYKFNPFFFDNKKAFTKAQARDRSKIEWCKLNNIDLVQLPDNEDNKEWTKRIKMRG